MSKPSPSLKNLIPYIIQIVHHCDLSIKYCKIEKKVFILKFCNHYWSVKKSKLPCLWELFSNFFHQQKQTFCALVPDPNQQASRPKLCLSSIRDDARSARTSTTWCRHQLKFSSIRLQLFLLQSYECKNYNCLLLIPWSVLHAKTMLGLNMPPNNVRLEGLKTMGSYHLLVWSNLRFDKSDKYVVNKCGLVVCVWNNGWAASTPPLVRAPDSLSIKPTLA